MKSLFRAMLLIMLTLTANTTLANPKSEQYGRSRLQCENSITDNPYGIIFFKPNYLLFLNYSDPMIDQNVVDIEAGNRTIDSSEVAFQISIQAPVWHDIFGTHNSLNIAYSQRSFWQAYVKSAYFRESNYQPEVFWKNQSLEQFEFYLGVTHESNGRGGLEERSWNRAYVDARYIGRHFILSVKPWVLIFKNHSSDLHNPDIAHYLGYSRFLIGYCYRDVTLSFQFRNVFESGFSRGSEEFSISFPVTKKIRLYAQVFSGYGQSLIEYDHYTNSAGIGISLSDWLLQS